MLTKAGKVDKRTCIGRVLFSRLEEIDKSKINEKRASQVQSQKKPETQQVFEPKSPIELNGAGDSVSDQVNEIIAEIIRDGLISVSAKREDLKLTKTSEVDTRSELGQQLYDRLAKFAETCQRPQI